MSKVLQEFGIYPSKMAPAQMESVERMARELATLRAEVARVTKERDGLLAFKRSVDEALNCGDGSYRP